MIRICYSKFHTGDRKFGEKEPFENKKETGGICPKCLPLEKAVIQEYIDKLEGRFVVRPLSK